MGLPARQSESEPKAPPRCTEWRESGLQGPRETTVVTIPQMIACSLIVTASNQFRNKIPIADTEQMGTHGANGDRSNIEPPKMEQMGTGQILSRPKKIDGLLTQKVYAARKR